MRLNKKVDSQQKTTSQLNLHLLSNTYRGLTKASLKLAQD